MAVAKFAGIAAGVVVLGVVATFTFTQIMAPKNRLEACTGGGVVGGSIGGPFELMDHTGQMVTDANVLDMPSLVYFGYTFCPDVCPVDVARNAVAVDILAEQGVEVRPIFITIDPTRDTPEYLSDFVQNNHPNMVGLTGTPEQIAKAARAYKAYYRKQDATDEFYLMDHSTFTYLMLPDQGFVDFIRNDVSPTAMAETVACYVNAA